MGKEGAVLTCAGGVVVDGCRVRKFAERFQMTEVRKDQNRM